MTEALSDRLVDRFAVLDSDGGNIVPDQVATSWPAARLIPPIGEQPPAKVLDQALDGIAARYGMRTAYYVAMRLEYPKQTASQ